MPIIVSNTTFSPEIHGFAFPNYFELGQAKTKLSLSKAAAPVYGLCGGMCFAALDYYFAGITLPNVDSPGLVEGWLWKYLIKREIDTLKRRESLLFFRSMISRRMYLESITFSALQEIKNQIYRRRPVVLGIIRSRGYSNPTKNHQVLVVGFEEHMENTYTRLSIYDPNYSNSHHFITYFHNKKAILHDTGELDFGLFVIPYRFSSPPIPRS